MDKTKSLEEKIGKVRQLYLEGKHRDAEFFATLITFTEKNNCKETNFKDLYLIRGAVSAEIAFQTPEKPKKTTRIKESIAHLEKTEKLGCDEGEIYYILGKLYCEIKKYKESKLNLDKAIRMGFDFVEAYYLRGIVKMRMGQQEEGLKDLAKAVAEDRVFIGDKKKTRGHNLNQYQRLLLHKKRLNCKGTISV